VASLKPHYRFRLSRLLRREVIEPERVMASGDMRLDRACTSGALRRIRLVMKKPIGVEAVDIDNETSTAPPPTRC
jgi:hypothetical protein